MILYIFIFHTFIQLLPCFFKEPSRKVITLYFPLLMFFSMHTTEVDTLSFCSHITLISIFKLLLLLFAESI